MTNILKNSLVMQILITVIQAFKKAWAPSVLGRISGGFSRCYEQSGLKRVWDGFRDLPNPADTSSYGRFMRLLGRGLEKLGEILRVSLFYQIIIFLRDLYFRITKNSRVFGWIHKLNLHQWLLVVFAFYLPLEYVIRNLLGIAILASVWEELFIAAAAVFILWRRMLKDTSAIHRESPLDMFILLFIGIAFFLMCVVQPWPAVAVAGLRAQVEYMVWFFLILRLVENEKDARVLYGAFLTMAGILCLHGIYQYAIGVEIPSSWTTKTEMAVRTRVFSITGSPNIFGCLIVMSAPLAAGLMYYVKNTWAKVLCMCLTGMMCLCLLFTFSRGAWVGMVVAVLLFALLIDRRVLLLMGTAIGAILAFVPSITNRLTFLFTSDYAQASAVGGRALRWETGRMLLHSGDPWFGFGLGRFGGAVAMNNQVLDETEEFEYFYMDNYYLKTMTEMGYIGLIFFLLLIAAVVVIGLQAVLRSGRGYYSIPSASDALTKNVGNPKILAASVWSGMCGVLVHCYFENIFEEPYMMAYFWGLAALVVALGFYCSGNRSPGQEPATE